jgi:hypothetical protein
MAPSGPRFAVHALEEPAISIITVGELHFGVLRSAHPERNRDVCQALIDRMAPYISASPLTRAEAARCLLPSI